MGLSVWTKLCGKFRQCYFSICEIDSDRVYSYSWKAEMEIPLRKRCLRGKCSCHLQNQYAFGSSPFPLEFLSDTLILFAQCLKFIYLFYMVFALSFITKFKNVNECCRFRKFLLKMYRSEVICGCHLFLNIINVHHLSVVQ